MKSFLQPPPGPNFDSWFLRPAADWAQSLRRSLYGDASRGHSTLDGPESVAASAGFSQIHLGTKLVNAANGLNVTVCGSAAIAAGVALKEPSTEVCCLPEIRTRFVRNCWVTPSRSGSHQLTHQAENRLCQALASVRLVVGMAGSAGHLRLFKRTCKPQHIFSGLDAALAGWGPEHERHHLQATRAPASLQHVRALLLCLKDWPLRGASQGHETARCIGMPQVDYELLKEGAYPLGSSFCRSLSCIVGCHLGCTLEASDCWPQILHLYCRPATALRRARPSRISSSPAFHASQLLVIIGPQISWDMLHFCHSPRPFLNQDPSKPSS